VPLAEVGTIQLSSTHLKVTYLVACAPFPIQRSDPYLKLNPSEDTPGEQDSKHLLCFPLKFPNSLWRPFVLFQRFSTSLKYWQLLSKGYLVPISDAELCSEFVPHRCATFTAVQADGPLPSN
jgi:hypothetical protein